MKTILSFFAAILWLGVLSTMVSASSNTLPDPQYDASRNTTTTIRQPRKQLQTSPKKLQTPARNDVRPVLKRTEPFKPLPNDDRKEIDDSMDP